MKNELLLAEIGKRISTLRKSKGITQEALAEKMDVSIQMISNLEQGKKAIRPENLIKLCNILEISTDYILKGQMCSDTTLGEKFNSLSQEDKTIITSLIERLSNK